jgi:hypothetical protein
MKHLLDYRVREVLLAPFLLVSILVYGLTYVMYRVTGQCAAWLAERIDPDNPVLEKEWPKDM